MAFIHIIITASMLLLLFLLMSVWVVEVIKAFVENCHGEEDEASCTLLDCESKHLQMAHFFGASSSPPSPLPPLNPGATYSHPPLPLSSSVSHDTDISVAHSEDCLPSQAPSASLQLPPLNPGATDSQPSLPPINDDDDADDSNESIFRFDYYSQAPSPVDPTPVAEDDSEKYLLPLEGLQVVVRPKLFTAPIIILSPPSPKKKKRGTKKKERRTKLPISLSPSAPVPLQTLTPNYSRVFPRRERKSIPHPTPQAPVQVNPNNSTTIPTQDPETCGDNRVLAEVVLRPTVSTAPVISITPPSPKKKQGTQTEKSITLPTSPFQNLTPDYHRDFTRRTPTPTQEAADKENVPPLAVVSERKSSRRSREQQLKEYIPPSYLLAQRCIDIVHSRSARHAWVDEMLYGEPRKF